MIKTLEELKQEKKDISNNIKQNLKEGNIKEAQRQSTIYDFLIKIYDYVDRIESLEKQLKERGKK